MQSPPPPLLRMRNVHLSFGDVEALQASTSTCARGRSTPWWGRRRRASPSLVKMLSGDLRKEKGQSSSTGGRSSPSPLSSHAARIGMRLPEPSLIPSLYAVENIYAGGCPGCGCGGVTAELKRRCRAAHGRAGGGDRPRGPRCTSCGWPSSTWWRSRACSPSTRRSSSWMRSPVGSTRWKWKWSSPPLPGQGRTRSIIYVSTTWTRS